MRDASGLRPPPVEASVRAEYGSLLRGAEWVFTLLLTIEY